MPVFSTSFPVACLRVRVQQETPSPAVVPQPSLRPTSTAIEEAPRSLAARNEALGSGQVVLADMNHQCQGDVHQGDVNHQYQGDAHQHNSSGQVGSAGFNVMQSLKILEEIRKKVNDIERKVNETNCTVNDIERKVDFLCKSARTTNDPKT